MMLLQYTSAEHEDIDTIFQMSKELVLSYEDLTSVDLSKILLWLQRKIETNIRQYTCVWQDGKKVAYYRLEKQEGQAELDDFYVMPECRGRGIGTQILTECCRETQMPIFLYVFTRNTGAISLYQRHGFKVTAQVSPTRIIMTRCT